MSKSIQTVTNQDYYNKELSRDIDLFNTELAAIEKAKSEITEKHDDIVKNALSAEAKPDTKPLDKIAQLKADILKLDVRELKLRLIKENFQSAIIKARSTERTRFAELSQKRRDELTAGFEKLGTESRYLPGVINGDQQIKDLKAKSAGLAGFMRIVTEDDEARFKDVEQNIIKILSM